MPCAFWRENVFLRSNRRTRPMFNLHRCNFRLPCSDRWQHTEKITWYLQTSRLGASSTQGLGNKVCSVWTQRLLVFICFGHVALTHVLVIWIFINMVPVKAESSRKWKKKAYGFTEQVWAAPPNSDVLLLPLHHFVSGFCIDEWQEKWQRGVDKCCKMEQNSVY